MPLNRWISIWGLCLPGAFFVFLIGTGLLIAQLRERGERETLSPRNGTFVPGHDTQIFVQRLGDPRLPAVAFEEPVLFAAALRAALRAALSAALSQSLMRANSMNDTGVSR